MPGASTSVPVSYMHRWRAVWPVGRRGIRVGASSSKRTHAQRVDTQTRHESRQEREQTRGVPHAMPGSRLDELMRHPLLFSSKQTPPRYPIILCHGLYGFDVRGPFMGLEYHYWSATLDVLRERVGAEVYAFAVPPTGSIQQRAEVLHNLLLQQGFPPGQPLNFVGHSMGGLDARYLISCIRPREYKPVSLTTLATPHRGSPFMDWCNTNIGVGLELIDAMMSEVRPNTVPDDAPNRAPFSLKTPLFTRDKADVQKNPLSRALATVSTALSSYILALFDQPAYAMLSTRYMTRLFNPAVPNVPGLRYFSVATRTPAMSVLHPLWLPKLILDKAATTGSCGADADGSSAAHRTLDAGNDGLVSVTSAQWGEFLGVMENWDHWDIRGPGGTKRLRPARSEVDHDAQTGKWSAWWNRVSDWLPTRRGQSETRPAAQASHKDQEWNWREAALSEYEETTHTERSEMPFPAAAYALSSAYEKGVDAQEASKIAQRLADWISSHLPSSGKPVEADSSKPSDDSGMLLAYLTKDHPHRTNDAHDDSLGESRTARALRAKLDTMPTSSRAERVSTALLEIFPFLVNAGHDGSLGASNDTFERFWSAVCRNLYEEGF